MGTTGIVHLPNTGTQPGTSSAVVSNEAPQKDLDSNEYAGKPFRVIRSHIALGKTSGPWTREATASVCLPPGQDIEVHSSGTSGQPCGTRLGQTAGSVAC